jgi:hypothetical protein
MTRRLSKSAVHRQSASLTLPLARAKAWCRHGNDNVTLNAGAARKGAYEIGTKGSNGCVD